MSSLRLNTEIAAPVVMSLNVVADDWMIEEERMCLEENNTMGASTEDEKLLP